MRTSALLVMMLCACGGDHREVMEYCGAEPVEASPPAPVDVRSYPGAAGGFRIAFVSEGYSEDWLPNFRSDAQTLIEGMKNNPGMIVGRRPDLFTFHVISVRSATRRLKNADRTDTAFAGCFERVTTGFKVPQLQADRAAAARTVADAVGEVDVVVVLMNTEEGRASTTPAQVAAPGSPAVMLVGWPPPSELDFAPGATVDHELGHALIGLQDEYVEFQEAYPGAALARSSDLFALYPNVTDDPAGAKWSQLVMGAEPGGALYESGVFHPTGVCRMGITLAKFCPVCSHAIDQVLDGRMRALDTDGPPRCGIAIFGEPARVVAEAFDFTPPVTITLTIDGMQPETQTKPRYAVLEHWLQHEGRSLELSARCTDGSGLSSEQRLTFAY